MCPATYVVSTVVIEYGEAIQPLSCKIQRFVRQRRTTKKHLSKCENTNIIYEGIKTTIGWLVIAFKNDAFTASRCQLALESHEEESVKSYFLYSHS